MKNNSKQKEADENKAVHQEFQTAEKEPVQGAANANFPEQYEEDLSTDIRMTPQPLAAPAKARVKS